MIRSEAFRILFVGLHVTVAFAVASECLPADEPTYEGKNASEWLKVAESRDRTNQLKASDALRAIGPEPLIKLMQDPRPGPNQRGEAAWALSRIELEAKSVIPVLVSALREKRNHGGRHINPAAGISFALASLGPDAINPLLDLAKDDDPVVRVYAAGSLSHFALRDNRAMRSLIESLRDDDPRVIDAAERELSALARFGEFDTQLDEIIGLLIDILRHESDRVRSSAVRVLGEMGPKASAAVPALIEALQDKSDAVRGRAIVALGAVGPAAKDAGPLLKEALKAESATVRINAAESLWKIEGDAQAAVPVLIEILQSTEYERASAAQILGRIGPAGKDAVPALTRIVEHPPRSLLSTATRRPRRDNSLRVGAILALGSMETEAKPAIPALLRALRNREISVQQAAIRALGQLGSTAEAAIPALTDLLEDSDQLRQALALRALWEITGDATPRVHKLSEIIGSEKSSGSMSFAAIILGEMGPVARNAIPILIRTLNHDDAGARVYAAQALWKIDRQQLPVVIEVLVEEISLHPSIVAYPAAKTLGEMGPDAKAAVPTLVKLRWYPDVSVRTAVARALERIDPNAAAQTGVK